jgi:prepilin-type N-terminal cleavage/methylation domain-containing protein
MNNAERKGMTLIEVIVALAIISGAILSISAYMTHFARAITSSDLRATANELATSRIEEIKNAPRYAAIDSMYAKTETFSEDRYKGFTRQTIVSHTGGGDTDFYDYKTITVVVKNPHLSTPIRKTSVIAAF